MTTHALSAAGVSYSVHGARSYVVVLDGREIGTVERRSPRDGGGWRFRNDRGGYGDCATRHLAALALVELAQ